MYKEEKQSCPRCGNDQKIRTCKADNPICRSALNNQWDGREKAMEALSQIVLRSSNCRGSSKAPAGRDTGRTGQPRHAPDWSAAPAAA